MSILEFMALAAACGIFWLLMVWSAKQDQASANGYNDSVCEKCSHGTAHNGETLCPSCLRNARAKQIKEGGK